jgi:hypothetical protein
MRLHKIDDNYPTSVPYCNSKSTAQSSQMTELGQMRMVAGSKDGQRSSKDEIRTKHTRRYLLDVHSPRQSHLQAQAFQIRTDRHQWRSSYETDSSTDTEIENCNHSRVTPGPLMSGGSGSEQDDSASSGDSCKDDFKQYRRHQWARQRAFQRRLRTCLQFFFTGSQVIRDPRGRSL